MNDSNRERTLKGLVVLAILIGLFAISNSNAVQQSIVSLVSNFTINVSGFPMMSGNVTLTCLGNVTCTQSGHNITFNVNATVNGTLNQPLADFWNNTKVNKTGDNLTGNYTIGDFDISYQNYALTSFLNFRSGNSTTIGTDFAYNFYNKNNATYRGAVYNILSNNYSIAAPFLSFLFKPNNTLEWTAGIFGSSDFTIQKFNASSTGVVKIIASNLSIQGYILPSTNNTYDVGAKALNFKRIWATTFAGGEFADKAPGGYNYSSLFTWTYWWDNQSSDGTHWVNISRKTPINALPLYYSALKLNSTAGNWELANNMSGYSQSVAILPADDNLIEDSRLVILGGYKVKVYGNITIGDKLILSNRAGVLTNARGLSVMSLQYISGTWQYITLPVSTDPLIYNKYDSAQGVSATVSAIALESYNSNSTGIINVKVLNT